MSKLKGNDVLLQGNTGTDLAPVWKTVACITQNGLDSAADTLDGGSKCGQDQETGDITWTASFTGFYEKTPDPDQMSGGEIIALYQNKTVMPWRMINDDLTYYRGFTGSLANYGEQADYNTLVEFSSDINIKGALITTAPTT